MPQENPQCIPNLRRFQLSLDDYRFLTTIVVIHEVAHALTKHYFGRMRTSAGVGQHTAHFLNSEAGWMVERAFLGGKLTVEWDKREDRGNILSIDRVLVEKGSTFYVLGECN
jgi:hypothetical protein